MYKDKYVLAIILARKESKRLKNKMLLPFLSYERVIDSVLDRTAKSSLVDKVIFATSDSSADDCLAQIAKNIGLKIVRGSENDVVSRMQKAVSSSAVFPDVIVRVCSDNPLLMPDILDEAIMQLVDSGEDIVTPFEFNTYPFGCSAVVMKVDCLARIDRESKDSFYREHVENYCFDHIDNFSVGYQKAPDALSWPDLCLTLDYEIDYDRLLMYAEPICRLALKNQLKALIENLQNAQVGVLGLKKNDVRAEFPESVKIFDHNDNLKEKKLDLILSSDEFESLQDLSAPRGIIWPDRFKGELICRHKFNKPFTVFKMEAQPNENNRAYFMRLLPHTVNLLLAGPPRPFQARHGTGKKTLRV